MKLSNYIPLVALASLTSAMPASISVSVSVNDGSLRNSIHKQVDACTRPCFPTQEDCGEGNVRASRRVVSLDKNDFWLTLPRFSSTLGGMV